MGVKIKKEVPSELVMLMVLIAVSGVFLGGWLLMLLLGMFAGYMAMPGLAIGYWASTGVFLMVRLAFSKTNVKSS
jgi:hypothetical protein